MSGCFFYFKVCLSFFKNGLPAIHPAFLHIK
jgi:hypothetical protein